MLLPASFIIYLYLWFIYPFPSLDIGAGYWGTWSLEVGERVGKVLKCALKGDGDFGAVVVESDMYKKQK